jgi:hypothetical protein
MVVEIGEAIALFGATVPIATVIAHRVAFKMGQATAKRLAEHEKDDAEKFAAGGLLFKENRELLGLLLFLQATQSKHAEELIRVANPPAWKEHVEPRLKKFGRNGNGD